MFGFKKNEETEKIPEAASAVPAAADDTGVSAEIIAVITAAIAAMEGSVSSDGLIIRRINRVSGFRPIWGSAGTADCLESRKF
jgi:glutaconyl-CoA/methylmalonyl-CoA decarboxylase subunit delta